MKMHSEGLSRVKTVGELKKALDQVAKLKVEAPVQALTKMAVLKFHQAIRAARWKEAALLICPWLPPGVQSVTADNVCFGGILYCKTTSDAEDKQLAYSLVNEAWLDNCLLDLMKDEIASEGDTYGPAADFAEALGVAFQEFVGGEQPEKPQFRQHTEQAFELVHRAARVTLSVAHDEPGFMGSSYSETYELLAPDSSEGISPDAQDHVFYSFMQSCPAYRNAIKRMWSTKADYDSIAEDVQQMLMDSSEAMTFQLACTINANLVKWNTICGVRGLSRIIRLLGTYLDDISKPLAKNNRLEFGAGIDPMIIMDMSKTYIDFDFEQHKEAALRLLNHLESKHEGEKKQQSIRSFVESLNHISIDNDILTEIAHKFDLISPFAHSSDVQDAVADIRPRAYDLAVNYVSGLDKVTSSSRVPIDTFKALFARFDKLKRCESMDNVDLVAGRSTIIFEALSSTLQFSQSAAILKSEVTDYGSLEHPYSNGSFRSALVHCKKSLADYKAKTTMEANYEKLDKIVKPLRQSYLTLCSQMETVFEEHGEPCVDHCRDQVMAHSKRVSRINGGSRTDYGFWKDDGRVDNSEKLSCKIFGKLLDTLGELFNEREFNPRVSSLKEACECRAAGML